MQRMGVGWLAVVEMSMALFPDRQESRAGEGGRPKVRDIVSLTKVGGGPHTLRRYQASVRVADGSSVGGRHTSGSISKVGFT